MKPSKPAQPGPEAKLAFPILGDHLEQTFIVRLEVPVTVTGKIADRPHLLGCLAAQLRTHPFVTGNSFALHELAAEIEVVSIGDTRLTGLPPAPDDVDWQQIALRLARGGAWDEQTSGLTVAEQLAIEQALGPRSQPRAKAPAGKTAADELVVMRIGQDDYFREPDQWVKSWRQATGYTASEILDDPDNPWSVTGLPHIEGRHSLRAIRVADLERLDRIEGKV